MHKNSKQWKTQFSRYIHKSKICRSRCFSCRNRNTLNQSLILRTRWVVQ